MRAKLYSLWQKISEPLEILSIIVVCLLAITLLVVIILAYVFNVDVSGLRGKTLWDWLQLLIIPAVLAVGGYLFNYTVSRNEREATSKRDLTERAIASDNQQEAALQEHIDKISELLLEKHLRESQAQDEVRTVARVRTLTTLPRLNAVRKGSIVRFLYESQLINRDNTIISLEGADLSGARLPRKLAEVNLIKADLSEAYLVSVDLSGADLSEASLFKVWGGGTKLTRAKLTRADLRIAYLPDTDLNEVDLSGADLMEARLEGAKLNKADLSGASLFRAYLREADLSGADLSGYYAFRGEKTEIDLSRVNLSGANLSGARVTARDLNEAISLQGATMPDGSKHT